MGQKPRRQYTPEFRAEVVKLVLDGSRTLTGIARDLAIPPGTLGMWLRKARDARGESPASAGTGEISQSEREELRRLRRENERLRQEREILKKAAAFFAKEHL